MAVSVKWIFAGLLFSLLLLLTCCSPMPKEEKVLYYFFEEACGSCDREGEFYEWMQQQLTGITLPEERSTQCYNLFSADAEIWNDLCDQLDIPHEARQLPMVIAGENYVTGEENIKQQLRSLTCALYDITSESD